MFRAARSALHAITVLCWFLFFPQGNLRCYHPPLKSSALSRLCYRWTGKISQKRKINWEKYEFVFSGGKKKKKIDKQHRIVPVLLTEMFPEALSTYTLPTFTFKKIPSFCFFPHNFINNTYFSLPQNITGCEVKLLFFPPCFKLSLQRIDASCFTPAEWML